ncbi:MAG: ABC transporter permease [Clostridiales bacterium]|nr:ABC transporter permease [Clostridiales bacterium]
MRKYINVFYIALILLFLYAPILTLVLYSFVDTPIISIQEVFNQGLSFGLYKKLFNDGALMKIVWDTLLLAGIVAVLATVLGTLGAIGIHYSKGRFGKVVSASSRIPVINAEIVTAVALVLLFAFIFAESRSYFAMVIGHLVITTPFVVLSVIPKLKQMDSSLYEAALDLGASPFRALTRVVIPEILPGILSGFMLAITLSLDDYIISAYTKPAGFDTISTYVYGAMAKSNANSSLPALRALSAIIFVVIILVVVIGNIRSRRKEAK